MITLKIHLPHPQEPLLFKFHPDQGEHSMAYDILISLRDRGIKPPGRINGKPAKTLEDATKIIAEEFLDAHRQQTSEAQSAQALMEWTIKGDEGGWISSG